MDKRIILAVAGSGKTTYIVNQLTLDKRSLVVTYTTRNYLNLKNSILRKFGHIPETITLMTYFSFLYSFCYRPFLSYRFKAKGITFETNPYWFAKKFVKNNNQINRDYFVDQHNRLYSNRIALLLELQSTLEDVNERLEKYFDSLYIDEVQDLAGNDFNFLKSISQAKLEMIFVGDFHQHTFGTSHDRNTNINLYSSYKEYLDSFNQMGFLLDEDTLINSYRCSPTVCTFIRDNLEIKIFSNKIDNTKIKIVNSKEEADNIYHDNNIVKLFYSEHYKYICNSRNWGESKGENCYEDVCVVLNPTTQKLFKKNKLNDLKPLTKNKLYVACSRANNDLYLVDGKFYKKYKM